MNLKFSNQWKEKVEKELKPQQIKGRETYKNLKEIGKL